MAKEKIRVGEDEPRRESFRQISKLQDEPKSDVALEAGGMKLRERVKRIEGPHGISLIFSYARLAEDGGVESNGQGEPIISDPHEVQIPGEAGLDKKAVGEALKAGREVAVAKAVDFFAGLDALPAMLSELLTERV